MLLSHQVVQLSHATRKLGQLQHRQRLPQRIVSWQVSLSYNRPTWAISWPW